MLPLQDINPRRSLPILTWAFIAINIFVFIWELSLSDRALQQAFIEYAVVPSRLLAAPFSLEAFLDVVRSMFLHGGFEHIIGNMLYLYLFGDNIEDRLGKIGFLVIYFVSGFVAAFGQALIDPTSNIPMIGASGAIAGILGSYLVLFPQVKVRGLIFFGYFASVRELPAIIVLGFWFVLQLLNGFGSLGATSEYGGGVAFFAHIGGFIAGLLITQVLMRLIPQEEAPQRNQWAYDKRKRSPWY